MFFIMPEASEANRENRSVKEIGRQQFVALSGCSCHLFPGVLDGKMTKTNGDGWNLRDLFVFQQVWVLLDVILLVLVRAK